MCVNVGWVTVAPCELMLVGITVAPCELLLLAFTVAPGELMVAVVAVAPCVLMLVGLLWLHVSYWWLGYCGSM